MKYFKKLVGERIYLSPMVPEDAEKYTKWFNDFKVTDGVGASGRVVSFESEREWLENNAKKENNYSFAIVNLANDELIGNCGFNNIDFIRRIATLGIFIGDEENRNKGYGKEIIGLLLDYGFNYLNLNNIMLNVYSFNERAISCYKKAGFKEIGRRRKACFLNGKYYDDIFMDILAEEFDKEYIKNKNV